MKASLLIEWGPRIGRLRELLAQSDPAVGDLAAAASDLADISSSYWGQATTMLLRASWHPAPAVRLAVIEGMRALAVPAILLRLHELGEFDASVEVRTAGVYAFNALYDLPPLCFQCHRERATLKPPESSDPHAPHDRPALFCSCECATEWALETAAELIDANDFVHHCRAAMRWGDGSEDNCEICRVARRYGDDPDAEKGSLFPRPACLTQPDWRPPARKTAKKAPRKKPRGRGGTK